MDAPWDTIWHRHLSAQTVTATLRASVPKGWTVEVLGLTALLHTAGIEPDLASYLAPGVIVEAHVLRFDASRGELELFLWSG